jgi:CheY-like chemotaxis protein
MNTRTPARANRILVADDDPSVLLLMQAIIEKQGCVMVAAHDGREAYRILEGDADFIGAVFDMVMPYLEGPDLIQYMRTEKRLMRIPVLMMTAEQGPQLPARGYKEGAMGFVPKPLDPARTGAMLRTIMHPATETDSVTGVNGNR